MSALGVSAKAVEHHGLQRAQQLAHRVVKKHAALIGPLRETARQFGYALAVHGSLKRDIDLVAIPWTEIAGRPVDVAEAIRARAHAVTGFAYLIAGRPAARKPHGRVGWEILLGGNVYIDLSVMPRATDQPQETPECPSCETSDRVEWDAELHRWRCLNHGASEDYVFRATDQPQEKV